MKTNQKAIEALEGNDQKQAHMLFKKAVQECRGVQSLTNLAYFLWAEEEDDVAALALLKESLTMNPISHFPLSLMGEIYTATERWQEATKVLTKVLAIEPHKPIYNNLAVASYQLGDLENAAHCFLLAAGDSDYTLYSYAKCLVELGREEEAISVLSTFSEEDEEFIGEVEVADLYLEAGNHEQAVVWFKKGWDDYAKDPIWIDRYVYALFRLDRPREAQELIQEAINLNNEESRDIDETETREEWTQLDKQLILKELKDEKNKYELLWERLLSGYIPVMNFEPAYKAACYLFGCIRHGNLEYQKK